jgi:hypothetical protein
LKKNKLKNKNKNLSEGNGGVIHDILLNNVSGENKPDNPHLVESNA